MAESLDSRSILRDLRSQIKDINNTVRKTRAAITDSEQLVEKANEILKDEGVTKRARWPA